MRQGEQVETTVVKLEGDDVPEHYRARGILALWAVSTGGRLLGYCVDEAEVEVIQAALQRSADDS
jgi:hypothetical protein